MIIFNIFPFQFASESCNFKILKLYDIGIHWFQLHVSKRNSLSGSSCISKKHESGSLLSWPRFCLSLLPTCSVESDEERLRDFKSTYLYSKYLVPCVWIKWAWDMCVNKINEQFQLISHHLIHIFLRNKTKWYLSLRWCLLHQVTN